MNCGIFRICDYLLVVAGLLMLTTRCARANDFGQANYVSELSGSYHVAQKINLGPQIHLRLQLQLANHGPRELHIQRLTLWDFPYADNGASESCSIVVPAGASANTTQEFTIPRAEYELWKRGARPRLVLQTEVPGGRGATKVVRLDRISGGKVN